MAELTVALLPGVDALDAAAWDACATGRDPFTSHRFLLALERSGSVGKGTGWHPSHLVARDGETVVGVAPLYLKTHSQGEYIFDHAWAEAWTRAGGQYYPKLQCAVPFTPATGPRLIAADPQVQAALLSAMTQIAARADLSSAHVTFCTAAERAVGEAQGWLGRTTTQFHWQNEGYGSYGDFLAALSSRKRKTLRKEREQANRFGGRILALTGDDLRPEHWDAMWVFYQDTGGRKWGRPYLTRAFFDLLHQTMRDDCLLFLAERDGRPVAGALNVIGRDTLFGRYWGCTEDHPLLHFELCYHRAIDWAIEHGLSRVEAGAQGEHKLARGYMPTETHSMHWVADAGFRRALAGYLAQEIEAVGDDIAETAAFGPYRRGDG